MPETRFGGSEAMRLWSIHPRYLDRQGLLALWREALLAQQVLKGGTRGYRQHPQLLRFRAEADPLAAIGTYLLEIQAEAARRGYRFDITRIHSTLGAPPLHVTSGQLELEWVHLLEKLRVRDRALYDRYRRLKQIAPHPCFRVDPGPPADWEKRRIDR